MKKTNFENRLDEAVADQKEYYKDRLFRKIATFFGMTHRFSGATKHVVNQFRARRRSAAAA